VFKKSIIAASLLVASTQSHAQSRLATVLTDLANFNSILTSQAGSILPLLGRKPRSAVDATTTNQPLGTYAPNRSRAYTMGDLPMSNPNTPMTCGNSITVSGGSIKMSNGSIVCSNSTSYNMPVLSGNTVPLFNNNDIPLLNGNSIGSKMSIPGL
jgi:hypothetical protein